MGYGIIKENDTIKYGVKSLIVDTEDDLRNLTIPCAVGSTAYCAGSKKTYILTPANEWHVYQSAGSSGGGSEGGGGSPSDDPSTDEDVTYDGGTLGN